MQNLCFHFLNILPKIQFRPGETSKSGDDERVAFARKPQPFRIYNAWQTRSIFLEKKFLQMRNRVSLFVCLRVFLIVKRNTSIANQRKELPLLIIWRVNDKCWVISDCHASNRVFSLRNVAQYFLHLNWEFGYTLYARLVSTKSELFSKAILQTDKMSKTSHKKFKYNET